jgi:hypothetical protein
MSKIAVIGKSLPPFLLSTPYVTFFDSSVSESITAFILQSTTFSDVYVVDDTSIFIRAPLNFGNARVHFVFWSGDVSINYHKNVMEYLGGAILNNFSELITDFIVETYEKKYAVQKVYQSFLGDNVNWLVINTK